MRNTKNKPKLIAKLADRDQEAVIEIAELATTKERVEFVWRMEEFFSLTEILLVMRMLRDTHDKSPAKMAKENKP